jgi:hypothetical protein
VADVRLVFADCGPEFEVLLPEVGAMRVLDYDGTEEVRS